jgi:hypothetical protein
MWPSGLAGHRLRSSGPSATRTELITFIDSVVKMLGARPYGQAMQGLVTQIATEPELTRTYRERVVEPRRAQLAPVIERGIARGDLRPDTDVRLVHELLVGPIYYRLLFSGGPLDRKLGSPIVDEILEGFAPRPKRAPARQRQ